MLVHGQLSPAAAEAFVERLRRVGQDFAQQHVADQKLPADRRRAFTLVVGMRSWLFGAFRDLKRDDGETLNELPEAPCGGSASTLSAPVSRICEPLRTTSSSSWVC